MHRRLILRLEVAALVAGVALAACNPVPSGGQPPGVPGSATASATAGSGQTPTPTIVGSAPTPTCVAQAGLVAVRATDAGTGFPLPVEWIGLGPPDETFFTQSEVAPVIPIDPAGAASITIALQYIDGSGDRYKLTGGSLTLAYDPTTGRVSGPLDSGYGKNSNRATTDTVPSQFDGAYTRVASPAGGILEGTITHVDHLGHVDRETYMFRLRMVEQQQSTIDPACASARPTDSL